MKKLAQHLVRSNAAFGSTRPRASRRAEAPPPPPQVDPSLGGRPRVHPAQRRDRTVSVAFTAAEMSRIDTYVKGLGTSRAAFVRSAIFVAMGQGPWNEPRKG